MSSMQKGGGYVKAVLAEDTRENPRLRVLDWRLPAGASASLQHACATLRWEVASHASQETPAPHFFEAGEVHSVENAGPEERRELVFELLQAEPRHDEAALRQLEAGAQFDTMIGTKVNFENRLCRAVEIHLPPTDGSEAENEHLHQHLLDYTLIWLDDSRIKFYETGPQDKAAFKQHIDVVDGASAMFKAIEVGDMSDWTVHEVANATGEWLRCYQLELK